VKARALVLALLVGAHAAAAQSAPPSQTATVHVSSSVSRTAVWVGDLVEFVVDFTMPAQADVIADDLAKEKLKLEGLQVVSTSSERIVSGERVTHRFRYVLSTYDPALSTLRIHPWPVRYYIRRPGERAEDVRPVGEVQVPAATVARRSTLPDELTTLDLRAAGSPATVPRLLRGMRVSGLALMLLSIAPLAVWTTVMAARWRSRTRRPRASVVRAHTRSALEELRAVDAETNAQRRDAYGRLERALRDHFAATREVPARALVAGELAGRLRAAGSPHADAAGELLAECERARYAPPERVPSKARFAAALEEAERILAGARS